MVSEKVIFIDANIYLRFYDSSGNKFRGLLKTLVELKDQIFITEQIYDEIQRNKLSVSLKSFSSNSKLIGVIKKTTLPEHLDNCVDEKLKKWNDDRVEIIKDEERLKKEYSEIVNDTLHSIMASEDNVSNELSKIFTSVHSASSEEIIAARLRKELGNPPGKPSDPLGDQLTWEQFLTKYSTQEVWIITADEDYYSEFNNQRFLNPYLYNELKTKSYISSPKIHLFKTLADGISDYSLKRDMKIDTLPSIDELEVIRQEEVAITIATVDSSNISSIGYDESSSTLQVEFTNGTTYEYFDVPEILFEGLLDADSVGKFLAVNIKGSYRYSKM
jgi:hypothetical protein